MSQEMMTTVARSAASKRAGREDDGESMLALDRELSAYLLRLIAGDLRRGARSVAGGRREDATALAMFLNDRLPSDLQTSVPAFCRSGERRVAARAA